MAFRELNLLHDAFILANNDPGLTRTHFTQVSIVVMEKIIPDL